MQKLELESEELLLLEEVAHKNVTLWVTAERGLHFRTSAGALSDELRLKLSQHKEALIEALSEPSFSSLPHEPEAPFLLYYHDLWRKLRSGVLDVSFTNATHWVMESIGSFDAAIFAESIGAVVERHRILESRVEDSSGEPVFVYDGRVSVQAVDLVSEAQPHCVAAARVVEIVWRAFAPHETLFRPFLVRVANDRHILGFVINHLIADAISISIVAGEILQEYVARVCGIAHRPQAPAIQYRDFLIGMNAWLRGRGLSRRLRYWKKQLRGATQCKLLTTRKVHGETVSEVGTYEFGLGARRSEGVYNTARRLGTTPYYLLLAAQALALADLTGEEEVCVLTMHHGRDHPQTLPVVGSFQNQVVLRIYVARHETFESLCRSCQQVYADAMKHVIPYHYVHTCVGDVGNQEWFPEFNCFVNGAPKVSAPPPSSAEQGDHDLPQFVPYRVDKPTSTCIARYFPGHKLTVWSDETQIAGKVLYLIAEHDTINIVNFVEAFMARIDRACQT